MKSLFIFGAFFWTVIAVAAVPNDFVDSVTQNIRNHVACVVEVSVNFQNATTLSSQRGSLICDGAGISSVQLTALSTTADIHMTLSLIAKNLIQAGMAPGSCEIGFQPAWDNGTPGLLSNSCWFYAK